MRAFYCCTAWIVVIDAETIDRSWSILILFRRQRIRRYDEITGEKQRVSEAVARLDAQHEKLTAFFSELEATERVLARYSKGTQARKTASARTRTTTTKAAPAPGACAADHNRKTGWRQARLIEPERSSPCLGNRQNAGRKLPPRAEGLAQIMSAPRLPGTSGLAGMEERDGKVYATQSTGTEQRAAV